MVKITLEYGSVEEAIQALGKLSGLAKVRRAAAATTTGAATPGSSTTDPADAAASPPASAPVAAPTKQRKPRNDAGKPRGPHKKAGGEQPVLPVAGTSADQAVVTDPVVVVTAAEPASAPAAEQTAEPKLTPADSPAAPSTEEAAKVALEAYFDRHGPQKAMALLAGFGVSKLRELPAEKRAAFIKACEA